MFKPLAGVQSASRIDLVPCTASTTYFSLVANTLTRIAATNTGRMSMQIIATSTPGGIQILRPGYGLPNPTVATVGVPIQSASSSVVIDDSNLEIGSIWAFSSSAVGNIVVQECSFGI